MEPYVSQPSRPLDNMSRGGFTRGRAVAHERDPVGKRRGTRLRATLARDLAGDRQQHGGRAYAKQHQPMDAPLAQQPRGVARLLRQRNVFIIVHVRSLDVTVAARIAAAGVALLSV